MDQSNIEDEKSKINPDNNILQSQKNESIVSNKQYFTIKCKWITFSVFFFVLAGIGIFLGIYLTQKSSAPTLEKFQRDEFLQVDQICMNYISEQTQNCTEIHMKTKRVVNNVNQKNASSLVILTSLKVRNFVQNFDGTREYDDMVDQNIEIEKQIKKQLRILKQSELPGNGNLCEAIPAEECGNVNQVPLVTVVTDQQTGAVQQIGIPAEIPDLLLQPLISNILHIAPNVDETSNNNRNRLLKEDQENVYYIGKEGFLPKTSKEKSWFGNTIIKKTISQSDLLDGSSKGINLFDIFEQIQETNLDYNNYLVSSHIATNSKLSHSVQTNEVNQSTNDLSDKSETEITNDSNLITVETKSDEDLTNILSEIQTKQTLQHYSISDLQDKIQSQQQGGSRLLENENGDVHSSSETDYESQEGECLFSNFNQTRTLKEATVFRQRVGLQAEFKGQIKEGNASGYLRSFVSLNGECVVDLYQRDFSYEGKPLETFQLSGSQSQRIFSTVILIMGYPLTVGADYNHNWNYIESNIKTESEFGISEYLNASLSVTAYGELNIMHLLNIRAGVEGYVFKGSVNGVAQFKINQIDNAIIPDQYIIFLDFQIEPLTFDVYASYQTIKLSWVRQCVGKRWWKICWYYPRVDYSSWQDVYRKSFQNSNSEKKKRIFSLTSKCY